MPKPRDSTGERGFGFRHFQIKTTRGGTCKSTVLGVGVEVREEEAAPPGLVRLDIEGVTTCEHGVLGGRDVGGGGHGGLSLGDTGSTAGRLRRVHGRARVHRRVGRCG